MQFSQELSTLALSVFDRPYAKVNTMLKVNKVNSK